MPQHHDQIVTSSDLGLSLRCLYSLGNRTVSHTTGLNVNGQLGTTAHESAVVRSPNVSMSITDRQGADIVTAQVRCRPAGGGSAESLEGRLHSFLLRISLVNRWNQWKLFCTQLLFSDLSAIVS